MRLGGFIIEGLALRPFRAVKTSTEQDRETFGRVVHFITPELASMSYTRVFKEHETTRGAGTRPGSPSGVDSGSRTPDHVPVTCCTTW